MPVLQCHLLRAPAVRARGSCRRLWDTRTSRRITIGQSARLLSQFTLLRKPRENPSNSTWPWPTLKSALLRRLRDGDTRLVSRESLGTGNAAVILASKEYHRLLDDSDVMSRLLSVMFPASSMAGPGKADISVLFGVVDAIAPTRQSDPSGSGIAVLGGTSDDMLPALSAEEATIHMDERPGSLRFQLSSMPGIDRPTMVTLPLANTVFQNGHVSTLIASRWRQTTAGGGAYRQTHAARKRESLVVLPASQQQTARLTIPLEPITPRRRIVSGLGNIVRQVEVDGQPEPASAELETRIGEYLASRQQHRSTTGPVNVWAWVLPPAAAEAAATANRQPDDVFSDGLVRGGRLYRVRKYMHLSNANFCRGHSLGRTPLADL